MGMESIPAAAGLPQPTNRHGLFVLYTRHEQNTAICQAIVPQTSIGPGRQ